MRPLLLAVVWSLLLYSCKEVTFNEPQPSGVAALKEVPTSLRGTYQTFEQTTGEFSDTLIIEPWGYHMKDKDDKDWLSRGTLSDTLVLKVYENYYFVNFKSGDQWVLRLVKQDPNGSLSFLAIDLQDDTKRKTTLKKISKDLKIKEFQHKDDTFYQINPTPAQLMKLIKDGLFTGPKLNKIK
ncbi:MAG TPA: hypothetical protein VGQ59_17785 [Cyclobacteriaceae bacterium]|nr:hypothetical protein [Cyclobacteriaceae bacterium]